MTTSKTVVIAESYRHAHEWAFKRKMSAKQMITITPDNYRFKLCGLWIDEDKLYVIGDPTMSWSFWSMLEHRIKNNPKQRKAKQCKT